MSHIMVEASTIRIENRQRKEAKIKDIEELAASIQRVGLIHAPVVNQETRLLVAGERRMQALALVQGPFLYGDVEYTWPDIPVHFINRTDDKLLFEIELEENLRRINLTPMEEAQAIAQLHNVRFADNPQQTRKDTAKEIAQMKGREPKSYDEELVADALILEQFLDDEEVVKASKVSTKKAVRLAKKKMEIAILRALSNSDESTSTNLNLIYPGDCHDILPGLPNANYDILLFDPPYGISSDKFGEQAMDLGHQYNDSPENANYIINFVAEMGLTLLKPNAHVLMFCAFEYFEKWRKLYESFEYSVWPRPLIWSKGQQSHAPVPDYGPRYSYECILFASRGQRKINRLINDVITVSSARDKIHAAEKPVELFEVLIDFVGRPGDQILDPCTGSGNIFLAGKGKEVYITGIEIDPNYYAVARERARA